MSFESFAQIKELNDLFADSLFHSIPTGSYVNRAQVANLLGLYTVVMWRKGKFGCFLLHLKIPCTALSLIDTDLEQNL